MNEYRMKNFSVHEIQRVVTFWEIGKNCEEVVAGPTYCGRVIIYAYQTLRGKILIFPGRSEYHSISLACEEGRLRLALTALSRRRVQYWMLFAKC